MSKSWSAEFCVGDDSNEGAEGEAKGGGPCGMRVMAGPYFHAESQRRRELDWDRSPRESEGLLRALDSEVILLHSFIEKSQVTPKNKLEIVPLKRPPGPFAGIATLRKLRIRK